MTAKNVLVVGGAGGVGSALVNLLVERGSQVVATVLDPAEAAWLESRHGGLVTCHIVDLSDANRALSKVRDIVSAIGTLDAVGVCAAIAPTGPTELTPLAAFRRSYEINCVSNVAIYQATLPALRKTGGRIVLLGSMAGRVAFTFMPAYVATKFALEGLCDIMRREAEPQGVKVSLVQPGGIRTNLVYQQLIDLHRDYDALNDDERRLYGRLYEGYTRVIEASMSGNSSPPELVAKVVLEALEAEAPEPRYIAGQDAKEFLASTNGMSDRRIDEIFARMFLGELGLLVR